MKKVLSAVLCATLLCTTLLVSPVSAGWDRNYYSFNGTSGYAYCSTGVASNPAGYAVSVEDNNGNNRNYKLSLTYYMSGGVSLNRYATSQDFYIFLNDSIPTTNLTCLVEVDGATTYFYARG